MLAHIETHTRAALMRVQIVDLRGGHKRPPSSTHPHGDALIALCAYSIYVCVCAWQSVGVCVLVFQFKGICFLFLRLVFASTPHYVLSHFIVFELH